MILAIKPGPQRIDGIRSGGAKGPEGRCPKLKISIPGHAASLALAHSNIYDLWPNGIWFALARFYCLKWAHTSSYCTRIYLIQHVFILSTILLDSAHTWTVMVKLILLLKPFGPVLKTWLTRYIHSSMATNVSLEGLAAEWEQVRAIRDRVREHRGIFEESVGGKKLEANTTGAAYHVDVLLPLLKMLVNPESGDVGMCSIPSLEAERLAHVFNIFCLIHHPSHKVLCWAPVSYKNIRVDLWPRTNVFLLQPIWFQN